MKKRIRASCTVLLLIFAICFQSPTQAHASSVIPTDIATAENVLAILSQYDADAYHIIKTQSDGGSDFMSWFFGGIIISQIDTAVHETYHSYTQDQCSLSFGETIYLGGGTSYDVDYSIVYESGNFTKTEEMSRQIPPSLQTFRYSDYIAPGSYLDANTKSVFGLLNEFTAYYWGLRTMNALAQFLIDTGCGIDGWRAYVSSAGNNMTAYAEFKYWTLRYMIYIKSANPLLYQAILSNDNYCAAYRDAETKFAAEIARSKEIADHSGPHLQEKGFTIDWSDAAIYIKSSSYGNALMLDTYNLLMAELGTAEYVEMDSILKAPASQPLQAPAPVPNPSTASHAVLSPQNLTVNGTAASCETYGIDGSTYFKLRDIAYLLRGTAAQFSIGWDELSRTVSIISGHVYEPNGTELMSAGQDKLASAVESNQTILVDGERVSYLSAYNIGGSNYFKLLDLSNILGFEVNYIAETNTTAITAAAY